jgi:cbb3-type cytochrome oxidase maturation protein
MYFPYFVTYMLVGLAISLLVFFWALRNGQFRDQKRAGYLPLADEPRSAPGRARRLHRLEAYVLLGLVLAGVLATVAVLAVSLLKYGI